VQVFELLGRTDSGFEAQRDDWLEQPLRLPLLVLDHLARRVGRAFREQREQHRGRAKTFIDLTLPIVAAPDPRASEPHVGDARLQQFGAQPYGPLAILARIVEEYARGDALRRGLGFPVGRRAKVLRSRLSLLSERDVSLTNQLMV
jgi:hypothetical protein